MPADLSLSPVRQWDDALAMLQNYGETPAKQHHDSDLPTHAHYEQDHHGQQLERSPWYPSQPQIVPAHANSERCTPTAAASEQDINESLPDSTSAMACKLSSLSKIWKGTDTSQRSPANCTCSCSTTTQRSTTQGSHSRTDEPATACLNHSCHVGTPAGELAGPVLSSPNGMASAGCSSPAATASHTSHNHPPTGSPSLLRLSMHKLWKGAFGSTSSAGHTGSYSSTQHSSAQQLLPCTPNMHDKSVEEVTSKIAPCSSLLSRLVAAEQEGDDMPARPGLTECGVHSICPSTEGRMEPHDLQESASDDAGAGNAVFAAGISGQSSHPLSAEAISWVEAAVKSSRTAALRCKLIAQSSHPLSAEAISWVEAAVESSRAAALRCKMVAAGNQAAASFNVAAATQATSSNSSAGADGSSLCRAPAASCSTDSGAVALHPAALLADATSDNQAQQQSTEYDAGLSAPEQLCADTHTTASSAQAPTGQDSTSSPCNPESSNNKADAASSSKTGGGDAQLAPPIACAGQLDHQPRVHGSSSPTAMSATAALLAASASASESVSRAAAGNSSTQPVASLTGHPQAPAQDTKPQGLPKAKCVEFSHNQWAAEQAVGAASGSMAGHRMQAATQAVTADADAAPSRGRFSFFGKKPTAKPAPASPPNSSSSSGSAGTSTAVPSQPHIRPWYDVRGKAADKETLRRIDDLHTKARALKEEGDAMNRRALGLYRTNYRAVGDRVVTRAKELLQQAEEAQEEAAQLALHLHNIRNVWRLDLHGLTVCKALAKLAEQLEALELLARTHPWGLLFQIIVGKGKHSAGNTARIKPAVLNYLEERQHAAAARNEQGSMHVEMQRGNDGVVEVTLVYQQK